MHSELNRNIDGFITTVISSNGEIVLIGEPWANFISGRARVLEWDGNSWNQIGDFINKTGSNQTLGTSFGINITDPRIVTTGGYEKVKVFENSTLVSLSDLEERDPKIQLYPNPIHGIVHLSNLRNLRDVRVFSMEWYSIN